MLTTMQTVFGLLCVVLAVAVLWWMEQEHGAKHLAALHWGRGIDPAYRWFVQGWEDASKGHTDNKPLDWREDLTVEQQQMLCAYNSGLIASRAYPRLAKR